MPAVIRAKSWPSRSTSPTTVTPSARKAAASPAPGNPAPRQTGGSNDPRTPREQPKGSTQGEARVGGRGRARTTGSPNVGSCGGRVAAATCTGGVGFASLSAPRSVAGPGRSRSVTTMAPPTSQLQDPQPVGSAIHRPLTAADVMTAAEVAALLRVPRSTVEDWARRGIVPSRKVGRRRLYIRAKIEALLLGDDTELSPE
jgi:excisionase family DNA binding protein